MSLKTVLAILLIISSFNFSGCSSDDKKSTATEKEESRLSLVTLKENGNSLLTKGGEVISFSGAALKSGSESITSGSKTAAKKTGAAFSTGFTWVQHKFSAAGDYLGELWDSARNADPLRKEMVAHSLTNLKEEVNTYNNTVQFSQTALDKLYEDKNKTTVTLNAVSKYADSLGNLPLGYSDKITATRKDYGKYNEDLNSIKTKLSGSQWNTGQAMTTLGDAATTAGGTQADAQTIDAASAVLVKIASACGKEDAANLIDSLKGAAKMAVGISSILAVTGADMGVSTALVVAGPVVLKMVDTASNAYSERSNNKKLALEANNKAKEVIAARTQLEQFNKKVIALDEQITQQEAEVSSLMSDLLSNNVTSYTTANETNKTKINTLIDKSNHLAKLLVTTVK